MFPGYWRDVKRVLGVKPKGDSSLGGSFTFVPCGTIGNQAARRVDKSSPSEPSIARKSDSIFIRKKQQLIVSQVLTIN